MMASLTENILNLTICPNISSVHLINKYENTFQWKSAMKNAVRRTGFIKWRRRFVKIGERRGLWNSIDLRALPGLCYPCRRRCTQSQDQGFGIWNVQSISSHFVRRKILQIPKKSHPRIVASPPPPLLRRARISAAHMTYLLLSVIVAPSISSRSENAAILWQFFVWFYFHRGLQLISV